MRIQPSFETNTQLAEPCQPGMSPFDHPTMATKPLTAVDPTTSNPGFDAPLPKMVAATAVIVTLVRMQPFWPLSRLAR